MTQSSTKRYGIPLIGILTGPTATGKSTLAVELARKHPDIELINADSMLVYRGMDIGTAKPTENERTQIPHHLIDVRNPEDTFTAGDYVTGVEAAIKDIQARKKRPLIVGGTGFYLKALLYGLWDAPKAEPALRAEVEAKPSQELFRELEKADPDSAYRIGPADHYRLVRAVELFRMTGKTPTQLEAERPREADQRFALWIIDRENDDLFDRVKKRTVEMLAHGFIDEVKAIRERAPKSRALEAVGYAQVCTYLDGATPDGRKIKPGLEGLTDEIELATRQLVKRQRTWFKGQHDGKWFVLDKDRAELARAFEEVYGK